MKKYAITILTIAMLCCMSTAAFAKVGMEVGGSFGFGTGVGDYDTGYGFNVGVGYSVPQTPLQLRADMYYFNFGYKYLGLTDFTYKRIPIDFSGRYYFPITDKFKAFAQGGVEISMDKFDEGSPFNPVYKTNRSETNVGVTAGGGVEYYVIPELSLYTTGILHVISDNYFSMHFGAAFHF